MADYAELQRAGHSVTGHAWITNPVRRALLVMARPYFQRLLQLIEEQRGLLDAQRGLLEAQRARLETQRQALEALQAEAERRQAQPAHDWAEAAGLRDLARAFDGLRKDQMALNHRLGSIEDRDAGLRQADPAAAQ